MFTKRCAGCGAPINVTDKTGVCKECKESFNDISDKIFYVSGVKMLKAVYSYSGAPRRGLHRFKFRNDGGTGEYFADKMAEMLEKERFFGGDCVLVPIPGNIKGTEREYVQAVFLSKRIAKTLKMKCVPDALLKKKAVKSQTKCKTASERRTNVEKAFKVNKKRIDCIKGHNILLVDDIATTGSTLTAAASALAKRGAGEIFAVCAAKTPLGSSVKRRKFNPEPECRKLIQVK